MSRRTLEPLWSMWALLDIGERRAVLEACRQGLHAPPTAADRRIGELGLLARMLDERPQEPDALPYVERQIYEARRRAEAPEAVSARTLVDRYGSWKRVCV